MAKKVLILHNMANLDERPSGIFVYEQLDHLKEFGCSNTYSIHGIRRFKWSILNYLSFRRLLKLVSDIGPDIVHVHFGLTLIPLLVVKVFTARSTVIVTLHGSDLQGSFIVNCISNLLCLLICDKIIVVSEKMCAHLWRCNREKVVVIPCAVDTAQGAVRNCDLRELTVLFPADPERQVKNFPGYLRIVKRLQREGVVIKTILLTEFAKSEVSSVLKEVDLVILVSHSEGSPQIIKEAISIRKPVFALNVGDVANFLAGVSGCFVSESLDLIANKILDTTDYPMLRENECEDALRPFSKEVVTNKILQLYDT